MNKRRIDHLTNQLKVIGSFGGSVRTLSAPDHDWIADRAGSKTNRRYEGYRLDKDGSLWFGGIELKRKAGA